MKIVELIRLEESEKGTVGVLKVDKEVFCFTLEPPDILNRQSISSIPAQQYICRRHKSEKYNTFQVMNVPDRTNILFHPGNTVSDTAGCILLGSEIGKLKGDRAVLNSGITFKGFMEEIGTREDAVFHLTITTNY